MQSIDSVAVHEDRLEQSQALEHGEADGLNANARARRLLDFLLWRLLEYAHAGAAACEKQCGGRAGRAEADDADCRPASSCRVAHGLNDATTTSHHPVPSSSLDSEKRQFCYVLEKEPTKVDGVRSRPLRIGALRP